MTVDGESFPDESDGLDADHAEKSTVTVPLAYYDGVEAALSKLSKRAAKLGLPPVEWKVVDTVDIPPTLGRDELREAQTLAVIEISTEPVQMSGWSLQAVLDWTVDNEGAALQHTLPGQPEHEKPDVCRCDHCGTNRDRNRTFVVRSDDGETRQVGSSCLTDFVGGDPAAAALAAAQAQAWVAMKDELGMDDREMERVGWGLRPHPLPIRYYMAFVAQIAERSGFVSQAEADEAMSLGEMDVVSTADWATELAYGKTKVLPPGELQPKLYETALVRGCYPHPSERLAHVDDMLNLLRQPANADEGEYMDNLRVLAKSPVVQNKHLRMAASILPTYERMTRSPYAKSHLGETRQRPTFDATVESLTNIHSYMPNGPQRVLYRFRDDEDRLLTWLTARKWDSTDLAKGDLCKIKGTIKSHNINRRGDHETRLSRCVVLERHREREGVDAPENAPSLERQDSGLNR